MKQSVSLFKIFFVCLMFFLSVCSCVPKRTIWFATITPSEDAIVAAMAHDDSYPYRKNVDLANLPQFEAPKSLRPCCVFGMDVQVSLKSIPIPLYRLINVTSGNRLGPHVYDAGVIGVGTDRNVDTNEKNGIIYTCRGGFIDIAHVRDYSDLTICLFYEFFRNMNHYFDIELHGEMGPRIIEVEPVEIQDGGKSEKARVAVLMAAWTAYQLSLWHEIAQWHGYNEVPGFSEEASAYSLEDAYSNILGINIACGLIYSGLVFNDNQYARNFDVWSQEALGWLGYVSRKEARLCMKKVDSLWWDSTARVPEKFLVLKRNYNMSCQQSPLLVSSINSLKNDIDLPCNTGVKSEILSIKEEIYGSPISDWVHIKVYVSEKYRQSFPEGVAFLTDPDAITPDEFQAIADRDRETDKQLLRRLKGEEKN